MSFLRKIALGVRDPAGTVSYARRKAGLATFLLRTGQIGPLVGFLTHLLTNRDVYVERLAAADRASGRGPDAVVLGRVHDSEMYLNLLDEGISQELYYNGTRERETTAAYRRLLGDLRRTSDTVTVLEIGCNIGYYAIVAAEVLGEAGTIHAFEPEPRNVELLAQNLSINGYSDRVMVHQCAIGAEAGTAEFQRHPTHSNWGHMTGVERVAVPDIDPNPTEGERLQVEVKSVDGYLREASISPDRVDVVRMDVEGYEREVLAGMSGLLESAESLAVVLEVHSMYLDPDDIDAIVALLDANGFTIVHSDPAEIRDFEAIHDHEFINLLLRKAPDNP